MNRSSWVAPAFGHGRLKGGVVEKPIIFFSGGGW